MIAKLEEGRCDFSRWSCLKELSNSLEAHTSFAEIIKGFSVCKDRRVPLKLNITGVYFKHSFNVQITFRLRRFKWQYNHFGNCCYICPSIRGKFAIIFCSLSSKIARACVDVCVSSSSGFVIDCEIDFHPKRSYGDDGLFLRQTCKIG